MDTISALVAFHSIYWVRVAVESYLEHFPDHRLLVVNNNPRRGELGWYPYCEEEWDWLAAHPRVLLVDNPRFPGNFLPDGRLDHGSGIDTAANWCRAHGVRVLVHLEPDCLITGRQWRENLLKPLGEGAWMAGSLRQSYGPIHPTPSAWLVDKVHASFKVGSWAGEEDDPRFSELIDLAVLENDPGRQAGWVRKHRYWDTGHAAWFECARRGRAALVQTPDFRHYWFGSVNHRFSERTLAARFPEVQSYLERARRRQPSVPVEECPYREPLGPEGLNESACCRLLQRWSGVKDISLCRVSRDACVACCASGRPSAERIKPVLASLLYGLAQKVMERGGVPGCPEALALELRRQGELNAELDLP